MATDRLDEDYLQERYTSDAEELARWWSQQITPPTPTQGEGPPTTPQAPTPDISMTIRPQKLASLKPPSTPQKFASLQPPNPYGTDFPNIMADTLANLGLQAAPHVAGAASKAGAVTGSIGREAARIVVGGVMDAFQKTIKGVEDLSLMAGEQWMRLLGEQAPGPEDIPPEQRASGLIPEVPKSESTPLTLARGLVRTAMEVATFGSMLRGAGTVGRLTPVVLDAMVDFFGQDPDEGRLTDLVLTMAPELANTPVLGSVVSFLKTDPSDGNALARLKNVIEGQITGRVLDVAMHPKETAQLITDGFDALRQSRALPAIAEETKRLLKSEEGAVGPFSIGRRPNPPEAPAAGALLTGEGVEDVTARVNLERIRAGERTKTVLETVNKLNVESGATEGAVRGVVSHADTKAAAAGKVSVEQLLSRQPGELIPGVPLNEQITAARRLRVTSANYLTDLAERATKGDSTAADLLYDALAVHGKIDEAVTGMSAEVGRALEAHKIAATSEREAFDPASLGELADRLRGIATPEAGQIPIQIAPDRLAQMILFAQKEGGQRAINTMARDAVKHPRTNMLMEAWINGLLSGPQTHAANFLSNTLTTFWAIPERTLAARLHPGVDTGVMKGEATQMLYGLVNGFTDALQIAAKSFMAGEPLSGMSKIEIHPAITSQALNISGVPGRAVDLLGSLIRTPGRALMAGDEFFKAINYRMELHAQAFRQAAMEGLDGDDMARRMAQLVSDPPASVKDTAESFAAYQTFTNELGATGRAVMSFANSHPALRLILPFIRTPVNIFKYSMERTPLLNLFAESTRAAIKAGGPARDLALAKMSLGGMVMGTAGALAASGIITGDGPRDPILRQMLVATGWQPYSIKVGDTYYSYNRLDPIGMLLGISANIAELGGELPSADLDQLAMAAVLGTMESLTSKTYLQGFSNVMAAIKAPNEKGLNYLRGMARSIVPAGVAQLERTLDPQVREVNGLLDEIMARVPGWSDHLPVRRNLFGELILLQGGLGPDMISPVYTSQVKHHPVAEEIVRLGITGLSMPSKYMGGTKPPGSPVAQERATHGVELTPQEYDLLVRLAGNELKAPSGRGMHDELAHLITTPQYQRQSDGTDGGKAFMIRKVVQTYRQAAQVELRRRSPELDALINERVRERIEQRLPEPEEVVRGLGVLR